MHVRSKLLLKNKLIFCFKIENGKLKMENDNNKEKNYVRR